MCLLAWNWNPHSDTPLLLIGNRDEFYARPTLPLGWWAQGGILAGRDEQAGGTWLGVDRRGRLAALTNYRANAPARAGTPSRGELVAAFLAGDATAPDYLAALRARCDQYNPFNLLVYDGKTLMGMESRSARVVPMAPGLGAVSNADFHTPWPKLVGLQNGLRTHLRQDHAADPALWALLRNPSVAPDHALPRTGLPLERERALSAAFIATPEYGTRASSVVRIHTTQVEFAQEGFDAAGSLGRLSLRFETARSPHAQRH